MSKWLVDEARRLISSPDPVCPSMASHASSDIVSPGTRHRASGFCEAWRRCPKVPGTCGGRPEHGVCRVRSCPQCNLIMEELRRRCANGYLQRWNAARGFSSTAPLDTRAMPHKIPRHDAEFPATRCRSKRETQSTGRQDRWRRLIVSLRQPATSTPTYRTGSTPSNPPPIDSGKLFFGRP